MASHLRVGEVEEALEGLRVYLAGMPYDLGSKDERGFETTFYLIFDLLGANVQGAKGPLYKVGVNYSSAERAIDEWVIERV